jgi:hypothetical protein
LAPPFFVGEPGLPGWPGIDSLTRVIGIIEDKHVCRRHVSGERGAFLEAEAQRAFYAKARSFAAVAKCGVLNFSADLRIACGIIAAAYLNYVTALDRSSDKTR